jgi:hypothetical protein
MSLPVLAALSLLACARDHERPDAPPAPADAGQGDAGERDAGPGDAGLLGESQAEVTGTVAGNSMDVKDAQFGFSNLYLAELVATTGPHFEIALSDHEQACGDHSDEGQVLTLDLFQDPSAADSRVTEPGEYAVWVLPTEPTAGKQALPTDNLSVAIWSFEGGEAPNHRIAQAGSVTITEVSEANLTGAFDLSFEDGHLSGKFSAPFCESWKLNPGVPVGR